MKHTSSLLQGRSPLAQASVVPSALAVIPTGRQPCFVSALPSASACLARARAAAETVRQSAFRLAVRAGAATAEMPVSTAFVAPQRKELEFEADRNGLQRVKYERNGWNFWTWQGNKIHYAQAGRQGDPVVLLIHGYGASAYHWRYQFQPLVDAGYQVFAMDLLGFGLSQKAAVDYSNGKPWVQQIAAFIQQIIGGGPVVIAGNSLGAYASLAAAADHPQLISAVAMLNGAGPFRDGPKPKSASSTINPNSRVPLAMQTAMKRVALYFGFLYAKNPLRIKQVLDLVYVNKDQIDLDLVSSIVKPAEDPNAADVFFRINQQVGDPRYVDDLLEGFTQPMLLLWGDADPWIIPARARKVQALYPQADLRLIPSGHCPHDDTPELTNAVLLEWLGKLRMPSRV